MAKKKKSRKKKQGLNKPAAGKLETRLLGYWKKQAWGEFITLYQRHWSRAAQSGAAKLWNPAVYNLLLRTTFAEQDYFLLEKTWTELSSAPNLSIENQQCLQVIAVLLNVYQARAYPVLAQELPAAAPAPFAQLASKLQEILTPGNSSLPDYLQKRLKRARKGEKHLSLAARVQEQFTALRDLGFLPRTAAPLTQFKKSCSELNAALEANQKAPSPVLQDMQILARLMHRLYSKPGIFADHLSILKYLQSKGFQNTSHPATHSLLQSVLALGRNLHSAQWEEFQRLTLGSMVPELAPDLPQHLQKQLQALEKLKQKHRENEPLIKHMLDLDIWSQKERILLLLAYLQQLQEINYEILDYLFQGIGLEISQSKAMAVVDHFLLSTCNALQSIYKHCFKLGLQDTALLTSAARQWQRAVAPFPFFNSVQTLEQLIIFLHNSRVPDSVLLFPLLKRAEIEDPGSKGVNISRLVQSRIPLQVDREDLQEAISHIKLESELGPVLQTWKRCLNQEKYQELVRILLHSSLQNSLGLAEDGLFSPKKGSFILWTDIPRSVMKEFLDEVDQDFALYGLMRLSAQAKHNNPPMPANAKEASLFLDFIPPAETLDSLLKWMCSWPRTQYRNIFLATLIRHHAEYLTNNQGWEDLARCIAGHRLKKLAEMVWELWAELDLFQVLQKDPDFASARKKIQPLLPNAKKQKTRPVGKKQKEPPLLKVLEDAAREFNKKRNRKRNKK